jgi:hypothetical protein
MDVSLESVPRKCILYGPSPGYISRTMEQEKQSSAEELVMARDAIRVVASLKGRQRDSVAIQ